MLSSASLNNGCSLIKPVDLSLRKVSTTWACRKTAHDFILRGHVSPQSAVATFARGVFSEKGRSC